MSERVDCRFRANVRRLRTIRAARSDSPEDDVDAAPRRLVAGLLGESLGPTEDRRERVVQLVRDAGNRLAERRHFFRLEQLLIQIARLIVESLALADVAEQRFDAKDALRPTRSARAVTSTHTDSPSRRLQPQQIVRDRPLVHQPVEKGRPRGGIDEALRSKEHDLLFGSLRRIAEHDLEMRIGGERPSAVGVRNVD